MENTWIDIPTLSRGSPCISCTPSITTETFNKPMYVRCMQGDLITARIWKLGLVYEFFKPRMGCKSTIYCPRLSTRQSMYDLNNTHLSTLPSHAGNSMFRFHKHAKLFQLNPHQCMWDASFQVNNLKLAQRSTGICVALIEIYKQLQDFINMSNRLNSKETTTTTIMI